MWAGSLLGDVPSGSTSMPLSAQASPLVQGWATIALLRRPIREPLTLATVLVWNDPSSVSLHLSVELEAANSIDDQVTLTAISWKESDLAEALAASEPSSRAAAVEAVHHCVMCL